MRAGGTGSLRIGMGFWWSEGGRDGQAGKLAPPWGEGCKPVACTTGGGGGGGCMGLQRGGRGHHAER
jgi:hypothetical protein